MIILTEFLGELLALLAAILGAISAVAYRRAFAQQDIEPEAGVTSYLTILTVLFLPYVLFTNFPTAPAILLPFIIGGVVGFVGGAVFYFRSIRWVGAARAVPIRSSAPLFAPVFAAFFLKQDPTLPIIIGTIVAVLGVVLVVYDTRAGSTVAIDRQKLLIGIGSAILAAGLFAFYPIILRIGYNAGGNPAQATAVAGTSSLIIVLILGKFNSEYDPRPIQGAGRRELIIGACSLALAITTYLIAFSLAPVVVVIVIYGSLPIFSTFLSYLFLDDLENVTLPVAIGSVLVVAGIGLAIGG